MALLSILFAFGPGADAGAAGHAKAEGLASATGGRSVKFRASGASGLFGKTISIRGRLANESQEREFASIRYGGLGQPVSRTDWITVRNVSNVYLQMDIDPQFAMPGIHLHMRSDDPTTSHYLFYKVGEQWVQIPQGRTVDIFSYAGCGLKEFAWEDGGDFSHQDFFFELDSGPDCVLISRNSDDQPGVTPGAAP